MKKIISFIFLIPAFAFAQKDGIVITCNGSYAPFKVGNTTYYEYAPSTPALVQSVGATKTKEFYFSSNFDSSKSLAEILGIESRDTIPLASGGKYYGYAQDFATMGDPIGPAVLTPSFGQFYSEMVRSRVKQDSKGVLVYYDDSLNIHADSCLQIVNEGAQNPMNAGGCFPCPERYRYELIKNKEVIKPNQIIKFNEVL